MFVVIYYSSIGNENQYQYTHKLIPSDVWYLSWDNSETRSAAQNTYFRSPMGPGTSSEQVDSYIKGQGSKSECLEEAALALSFMIQLQNCTALLRHTLG